MGMVFGKNGVAEPAYEIIYQSMKSNTAAGTTSFLPYEIRKYGIRFAAETKWNATGSDSNNNDKPFTILARYIGVFGKPENDGSTPISMTAPVMKQSPGTTGTSIAMTAPVMKVTTSIDTTEETMMFVLPAEYDSMEKIPQPTNPAVNILMIPSQYGAVYEYSGSMMDDVAKENALKLGHQLRSDLLVNDNNNNSNNKDDPMTDEYILQNYQFWGYNPPFTLPMFRRNEIWIQLTEEEVNHIVNKGDTTIVTDAN